MRQRDILIRFRLNEKENETLKANISKTGLSQAAYLRTLINGCVPVEAPPVEYNKLIVQLRYIGGNINQITRLLNTYGSADLSRLNAELDKLDACEEVIMQAFLPRKRE